MQKIISLVVENTTQAKLILKPGLAIVKIPGHLSADQQTELRNKLIKVADMNKDNDQFLKLYYKINTPYLFLNRKVSPNKKETIQTYVYDEL